RWHREFLEGRPGPIDEVIEMPAVRGVGAAADEVQDDAAVEDFVGSMRARRFDLAVQIYGGGQFANPFIKRLGAQVTIGFRAPGAPPLDRWIPYEAWRNERLRMLEAVALAGARPVDLDPRIVVTPRDIAELSALIELPERPLVVLQPGATDVRRRWSPERFAAVGDALAEAGATIVVNGGPGERELTAQVAAAMRAPAIDFEGKLSVSGLVALLAKSRLLVSNDTGPLHLAQALGTPSVGIFWVMNLLSGQPLVSASHRFAFSARLDCPVCGVQNLHQRCEHEVSFVDDVSVESVRELALERFSAPVQA
ncbi:MAG TPA: glycosyltransferase family 9 protein, partial [Candidatus Synoicihabitans sp.]|nr:glycosyltransferase family 9 protein [Candidatus Synoicihabitans sp.]